MKSRISFGDFYLLLWCLYLLQGTLYSADRLIGKTLFVLILGISLFYAIYANMHYKLPDYVKALNVLLIMFSIYGVLHIMFDQSIGWHNIPTYYYLKNIYLSFLPIYCFFVFVKQGDFNENKLKVWIFIFCAVATASFFKIQATFDVEESTNNSGYVFLSILPITTVYRKKPLIRGLLMAYCSLFILMAMKRGAILIAVAVLLLLILDMTRKSSGRRKLLSLVLVVLFIAAVVYYVLYLLQTSDYFVLRLQQTVEGDSSYRDIIYANAYDYFVNRTSFFTFLFGNGADATIKLLGNYAHNDWLEIAINNGLVGVILYLIYYIYFIKALRKTSNDAFLRIALGTTFLIVFAKTFISMSYSITTIYTACIIGYCIAKMEEPSFNRK